jgi:deferrochelatase/peroxidase EfeB
MAWGGAEAAAYDAIALLYGADADELAKLSADIDITGIDHKTIEFQPNDGAQMREPSGFVDGVSQPILRDASKLDPMRRLDQLIAPGEIVLGHEDDSTFTPRTASLHMREDPHNLLPETSHDQNLRDFGRDGTFLVVRQLQQKVSAFNDYLRDTAQDPRVRAAAGGGEEAAQGWVAAKLMGRWRNGTSLVRYPNAPGPDGAADNDFRFGIEDPDGVACPFGAHIRRANPRDSFDAKAPEPLKITNRHRILRIGRIYRGEKDVGMMFMCLNADIERQFEFVQQTWLRAPSFHGLNNEVDPMAVSADNVDRKQNIMTVPTPQGPLELRGLSEFVQVIGSGYFFMPGRRCLEFLAARAQSRVQAVAAE